MLVHALPETARLEEMDFFATASRADHHAIWPAFPAQVAQAVVRIAEVNDGLLKGFRFHLSHVFRLQRQHTLFIHMSQVCYCLSNWVSESNYPTELFTWLGVKYCHASWRG